MRVTRLSGIMITIVPPLSSTCPTAVSPPAQSPHLNPPPSPMDGNSFYPPASLPCVSLEAAALNELVAQLVEQRPQGVGPGFESQRAHHTIGRRFSPSRTFPGQVPAFSAGAAFSSCVRGIKKQRLQIAPQMIQANNRHLRALPGPGQNESPLHHGLYMVGKALCRPRRLDAVFAYRRLNIRHQRSCMSANVPVAGLPDRGMRLASLLHHGTQQAGVIQVVALQNRLAEFDVPNQPLKRVGQAQIGPGENTFSASSEEYSAASSASSSLLLK